MKLHTEEVRASTPAQTEAVVGLCRNSVFGVVETLWGFGNASLAVEEGAALKPGRREGAYLKRCGVRAVTELGINLVTRGVGQRRSASEALATQQSRRAGRLCMMTGQQLSPALSSGPATVERPRRRDGTGFDGGVRGAR